MKTRAREIRKRKGLTLEQVAERMKPRTTMQTIGRLETDERKMTLDWLEKFATALDCTIGDLINSGPQAIPFAGSLSNNGRLAPAAKDFMTLTLPGRNPFALEIAVKMGDLEVGDTLICDRSTDPQFADCIGLDCLVTTEDDQQVYGRLLAGKAPGRFTVILNGDVSGVLYDIVLKSAARRTMLIRHH